MTGPVARDTNIVTRFPLQIADANLRLLHDYWDIVRRDRAFPNSAEIEIVDLPVAPGGLMLVDVAPNFMAFTVHWVGTDYVLWLRRDATGRQLEDLPPSPNAVPFAELLRRCADSGLPQTRALPAATELGLPSADILALPLGGADGKVNRLLVGSAFNLPRRRSLHIVG
ncbi:MAG: hypothetical protein PW843_23950 [Azospirillaceae bacterium]|nr:hypothetical protein [Azospirillaceae bacterium]